MLRGPDFDRLVQQRILAGRSWIDAQPGLVAQGRAVCLFASRDTSPDRLLDLVERFYRVFVFIAPSAKAAWMRQISRAGHRGYPLVVLVGREDNLERCRRLALEGASRLQGASILHLPQPADPQHLSQVEDLYAEAKMFPQPRYFVAGRDETVLVSLLVDADGVAIGTTTYHHLTRVGPGFEALACGLNSAVLPRRSRLVHAPKDAARASSLAAWLNASAILHCREQFGVREIWSYALAHNRRAIAFHTELGARESEDVCCFCVEHRLALPDRWAADLPPTLPAAVVSGSCSLAEAAPPGGC
jgi:hypothetical protein